MKAIRYDRYGPPEVLELRDIDVPAVGGDEVLVRVRAAAVNPLDYSKAGFVVYRQDAARFGPAPRMRRAVTP